MRPSCQSKLNEKEVSNRKSNQNASPTFGEIVGFFDQARVAVLEHVHGAAARVSVVKPRVPRNLGEPGKHLGIAGIIVLEETLKLFAGDVAVHVLLDPRLNARLKRERRVLHNGLLEPVQQLAALFVRNSAEKVVGIRARQILHKRQRRRSSGKLLQRVSKVPVFVKYRKIAMRLSVNAAPDLALQPARKALEREDYKKKKNNTAHTSFIQKHSQVRQVMALPNHECASS
jgi:hypothetical protein